MKLVPGLGIQHYHIQLGWIVVSHKAVSGNTCYIIIIHDI